MITVRELSRYYGTFHALRGISFEISEGEIIGFLGPNGAGKTTTMRIMTGALAPSNGQILFRGKDLQENRDAFDRQLGYLPESAPAYPEMSVEGYLKFVAQVRNLERPDAVESVMDLCAITDVSTKRIGELSKGYRQRVGLAQALIHDPQILILDEPSSGLDPNQIQEMMELIKSFAGHKTVLFSSHILSEVEAVATRVVILNEGQIVANDTLANLQRDKSGSIRIRVGGAQPTTIVDLLTTVNGVIRVEIDYDQAPEHTSLLLTVEPDKVGSSELAQRILSQGWQLMELSEQSSDIRTLFEHLTGHQS